LDREQAAIMENRGRGLGLMGDWHGAPNWYGGKVQQIFRLSKSDSPGPPYKVSMEKLESTKSNRFSRFLASMRIGNMRIDAELIRKERKQVHTFLSQNFVVCGRVFRPFTSKDDSAYLMMTDRDFQRDPDEFFGDQYRHSFAQFLMWHNPFDLNAEQVWSI
jgi:hypothetical protein